jgi:hypothetical protein
MCYIEIYLQGTVWLTSLSEIRRHIHCMCYIEIYLQGTVWLTSLSEIRHHIHCMSNIDLFTRHCMINFPVRNQTSHSLHVLHRDLFTRHCMINFHISDIWVTITSGRYVELEVEFMKSCATRKNATKYRSLHVSLFESFNSILSILIRILI